jgi:hypothetical protein
MSLPSITSGIESHDKNPAYVEVTSILGDGVTSILEEDANLSDFINSSVKYYRRTSLAGVGANIYKFRDDSIRPRRFLDADNENRINAILSDHNRHSLYVIIDGDELFHLFIDFDLSQKKLDAIKPSFYGTLQEGKLTCRNVAKILLCAFGDVCKEVFPE